MNLNEFNVVGLRQRHVDACETVDREKKAVRQLVGQLYRDFIQSTNSIVAIQSELDTLEQSLQSLHRFDKTTAQQREPKKNSGENSRDENECDVVRERVQLARKVRQLVETPERIYSALDARRFGKALQLCADARELIKCEQPGKSILSVGGVVERQWAVVESLPSKIRAAACRVLGEQEPDAASAVSAMDALDWPHFWKARGDALEALRGDLAAQLCALAWTKRFVVDERRGTVADLELFLDARCRCVVASCARIGQLLDVYTLCGGVPFRLLSARFDELLEQHVGRLDLSARSLSRRIASLRDAASAFSVAFADAPAAFARRLRAALRAYVDALSLADVDVSQSRVLARLRRQALALSASEGGDGDDDDGELARRIDALYEAPYNRWIESTLGDYALQRPSLCVDGTAASVDKQHVPSALSPYLYRFLFDMLYRFEHRASVPRRFRAKFVGAALAKVRAHLAPLVDSGASGDHRLRIQLLFDLMIVDRWSSSSSSASKERSDFSSLIDAVQQSMDPIDLAYFEPLLGAQANAAIQSTLYVLLMSPSASSSASAASSSSTSSSSSSHSTIFVTPVVSRFAVLPVATQ
jgi:Vps51/EXO84/COG1 N-terminal